MDRHFRDLLRRVAAGEAEAIPALGVACRRAAGDPPLVYYVIFHYPGSIAELVSRPHADLVVCSTVEKQLEEVKKQLLAELDTLGFEGDDDIITSIRKSDSMRYVKSVWEAFIDEGVIDSGFTFQDGTIAIL